MKYRKKTKPLWRVSVTTTLEAEDAISELLVSEFELAAAAYFDLEAQTSRVSVFPEQGKLSPADARKAIAAGLERIRKCGLNTGAAKIEIKRVQREDWAESWKRHFKPLVIKVRKNSLPAEDLPKSASNPRLRFDCLLIKPSWIKKHPAKRQAVVVLDPGLSFGTGQHPTTAFCLHEITRCLISGRAGSLLDIGTGSGILAIAAAKLGYSAVHAFDYDPESVRVARQNAAKNHVAGRLKLTQSDITRLPLKPLQRFDLVCANLISNLLIAERQRIANRVKSGGTLVLAGILTTEFSQVERAFADVGLKLVADQIQNEWRSGAFCFR